MHEIIITQPDDWHVHFRDDQVLNDTVLATAKHFGRALVMPNLKPPLTTLQSLQAYRDRILAVLPSHPLFQPMMTFYLSEQMSPEELSQSKQYSYILGAKLYPAGATTHSELGVSSIRSIYPLLDVMQENELTLQIHGETTTGDIFDREAAFIESYLKPIIQQFPRLKIVLEHISTRTAVEFVTSAPETVAATITPHHLLYQRNHLLAGGIKPHFYCLPILKREEDQLALQQAAVSGNPKFFAGTDSAPHATHQKESACGCAGIYSAPYAVALYAEVFEQLNKLDKLNDFMSRFGADFYQVPVNQGTLILKKQQQTIPETLPLGFDTVIPVAAGQVLAWSVHA